MAVVGELHWRSAVFYKTTEKMSLQGLSSWDANLSFALQELEKGHFAEILEARS